MDVNLQFLGAAHCVTGSKFLLTLAEAGAHHQVLVDCGLFQGYTTAFEWQRLPLSIAPHSTRI